MALRMRAVRPSAGRSAAVILGSGPSAPTIRHGTTILRPAGPWTPAVHALLRHLEQVGYPASPRVVGDGYDDQGHEVLTWVEGRIAHPHPYTDEAIFQVGQLLRTLHDATASFRPPPEAAWQPWSLRSRARTPSFGDDLDEGSGPDATARRGRQLRLLDDRVRRPRLCRVGRGQADHARVQRPHHLVDPGPADRAAAWILRHRPMLERAMQG